MCDDILNITKHNFEKTVIKSSLPVMLVLWSKNYPGCIRLYETVKMLVPQYRDSIRFALIDVDIQPELSSQLCIGGLPCVLILRNGRICSSIGGELPLSHYKYLINKLLNGSAPNP